jgi:2-haloacid dehalogenase/putative hydrolase of the HAD superfamily
MAREQLLTLIFEQIHSLQSIEKPFRRTRAPAAVAGGQRATGPDPALSCSETPKKWHHGRSMAIPKQITFVTFDVYGTLIDWETGAADAFVKEAARDGFTLDPAEIIPLFHSVQQQIQAGSYELYAEVLRRTAIQIARDLGWALEPSRAGFLPESVQRWPAFKETNPVLTKIAKKYSIGLISNIDDKLLGQTRRHIPLDFDLVVTAQQVRSYKPDPAHFTECERRIGGRKGWVHVAASYYHDIEPCIKKKIPVIWVNRHGEVLEANQKKPDFEVKNLREAEKLINVA